MPDQSPNPNTNAIKVALAAALGSALGIITAVRTLSATKRAAGSRQQAAGSEQEVSDRGRDARSDQLSPHAAHRAPAVLSPQSLTGDPDWEQLPPAHLPQPTYWPVVLALGIVFLAWGVVTTVAISAIGLALLALALGGWIGELRHSDG